MTLIHVHAEPRAAQILYDLLSERPPENYISHERMPSYYEHCEFVAKHPYRYWYLIEAGSEYVGAIAVTPLNEIGVEMLKAHQLKGYGSQALALFLARHEPLPGIPAVRNARWLCNIAAGAKGARTFWAKQGFMPIQETMAKL